MTIGETWQSAVRSSRTPDPGIAPEQTTPSGSWVDPVIV